MRLKYILLFTIILLSQVLISQQYPSIIPKPVEIKMGVGSFIIDKNTAIQSKSKELKATALYFISSIKNISDLTIPLNKSAKKHIHLILENGIKEEGYQLDITTTSITIKASDKVGIFYGMQSLLQVLPAIRSNAALEIPVMQITDYPRFKWRGMHLDVSRHFYSPEMIKEYLDLLAAYKINVFHWHLTDGGGWRLEIKKYPKLTSQAAWRVDSKGRTWNWDEILFNGDRSKATYGGYYTQEQAKEIVAYAKARNITVVPEIEMPGHSEEVMAAYPQLSCTGNFHFGLPGDFNASKLDGNFCAGNDSSFTFIEDVLKEVMAIFPSAYIHVGGDEVEKASWKACSKCQARMKTENLKNEEELQSYFMKRVEKFILSKNRKMIGWDEILEGGLAPTAAVMSWRGETGGIEAAKMGHPVVMTPGSPCYFDHYQAGPDGEPHAIGGFNNLKKVYDYEPIPKALNSEEAKFVLGAQANVWTEYIASVSHLEYMILPRMPALSEVLWSPPEKKDWLDFNQRLQKHLSDYDALGLNYCKGNFTVSIKPISIEGRLRVNLSSEIWNGVIRYTTDGTEPELRSQKYEKEISIDSSLVLKTSVFVNDRMMGYKSTSQIFTMHKAVRGRVVYLNQPSKNYSANGASTLTDGIRGNEVIGQNWHGFNGKDMVATIELDSIRTISNISVGFLQAYRRWIFLPSSVKFEISKDSIVFTEIKTLTNPMDINQPKALYDFKAIFAHQKARYIRITAKNNNCPPGHPGAGKPGWIFADEVVVE